MSITLSHLGPSSMFDEMRLHDPRQPNWMLILVCTSQYGGKVRSKVFYPMIEKFCVRASLEINLFWYLRMKKYNCACDSLVLYSFYIPLWWQSYYLNDGHSSQLSNNFLPLVRSARNNQSFSIYPWTGIGQDFYGVHHIFWIIYCDGWTVCFVVGNIWKFGQNDTA